MRALIRKFLVFIVNANATSIDRGYYDVIIENRSIAEGANKTTLLILQETVYMLVGILALCVSLKALWNLDFPLYIVMLPSVVRCFIEVCICRKAIVDGIYYYDNKLTREERDCVNTALEEMFGSK